MNNAYPKKNFNMLFYRNLFKTVQQNILWMRAFFIIFLLSAFLAACDSGSTGSTSAAPATEQKPIASKQREYIVGTEAIFPPFSFINQQKEFSGFDIDLIREIARELNIKIKLINMPFDSLIAGLERGDYDFLMASTTITEDRKKTIDFSDPYFETKQIIVLRQTLKDASKIKSLQDLKTKKVIVLSGTTGDEVMKAYVGKNNPNIHRLENLTIAIEELENGGANAMLVDDAVIKNYIAHNKTSKLRLVDDPTIPKEYYGVAIKKGNTELVTLLNQGLASVKASGSYQQLYQHYFGKAEK